MKDGNDTKQALRDYIDQRFGKLNPGSAFLITSEMLEDAFEEWQQAVKWYEAKGGMLRTAGPGMFRLKKMGSE